MTTMASQITSLTVVYSIVYSGVDQTGYDGIKLGPLKIVISKLTKPLVYICNMSLQEGLFPQELKRANVVPLYKENSMLFTNYRPVSLLCILSKVFERIMYVCMYLKTSSRNGGLFVSASMC